MARSTLRIFRKTGNFLFKDPIFRRVSGINSKENCLFFGRFEVHTPNLPKNRQFSFEFIPDTLLKIGSFCVYFLWKVGSTGQIRCAEGAFCHPPEPAARLDRDRDRSCRPSVARRRGGRTANPLAALDLRIGALAASFRCVSAWNKGSDSLLMQFGVCVAL